MISLIAFAVVRGLLVELGDADIADVVAFDTHADRADADHVARDRDLDRLVLTLAHDGQLDLGVHRPAHLLDRLVQGEALHLLAVELRDHVVRHHAGLRGGRLVDRRDDLDEAVFHRDLDAEPAELALGLHLHVAEVLRVHVARMRIEPVEHPVDRLLDQLRIVRLLDVVGADTLEHVAEQIELAVGVRGGGLRAGPQDQPRLRGEQRDRNASGCAEETREVVLRIIRGPFRYWLQPTRGSDRRESRPCETRYTEPAGSNRSR